MRSWILALTLALALPGSAGPEPARGVELSRLAGRWYVIGRMPGATGQHGLGAQVEYRLDGGMLEESYLAYDGSLSGPPEQEQLRLTPDDDVPARWTLKRGWLHSRQRLLLYVSPGYKRAIVGDAGRESAWVLAREPEIPEWSYAGLLARLATQGFDVSKVERVAQNPGPGEKKGPADSRP